MTHPPLDAALAYAARGWHVLPLHEPLFDADGACIGCTCEAYARSEANRQRLEAKGQSGRYDAHYVCPQPGKHPRGNLAPKGVTDASDDPERIKTWWRRYPRANVGIACGASGLLALDADMYKDAFAGDLSEFDEDTPTSLTGGGGTHLIYAMPDGATYGNSPGDLPEGIDIRGAGGYIVAPPSLHSSGRRYQWESGYSPDEITVAPMPATLRARLDATVHTAGKEAGPPDSEAVAASLDLVQRVLRTGHIAHGKPEVYGGDGRRIKLDKCPFNPQDNPHAEDGAAVVIIRADGQIKALCQHSRCRAVIADAEGNGWALLRKYAGVGVVHHVNGNGYHALTDPYEDAPHPADDPEYLPPRPTAAKLSDFGSAPADDGDGDGEDDTVPHPFPEYAPLPGPEMGWLYEATTLFTDLNDSPVELNLIAMLASAATAVQPAGVLRMGYEDVRCNLWLMGIAPSGSRKSTSAGKARRLLGAAGKDDWLFTGSATSEGLVRRLKQHPSTLWLVNEGATLLASHRKKYLQDVKVELCNVFDCMPISRNLANETVTAPDPRLVLLTVTTPQGLADSVETGDWHSGFMARWLYVVPETRGLLPLRPSLLTPAQSAAQEAVTQAYCRMTMLSAVEFRAESDAFGAWATWADRIRADAVAYEHEAVQALAERAPTAALKLAMILAACRGHWGYISNESMGVALALMDFFLSHTRRAMHTWDIAGADMSTMQKVLAFVHQHPGATTGPMRRTLNLPKHKIDACLRELANRGAVTSEEFEYKPGRFTTRYTAVYNKLPVKQTG